MPSIPNGSRPIVMSEIEQFGGAERSIVALSRWLYEQGKPNHLVTYIDHCNLPSYASHPFPVVELRPAPGAHNKIAAMRKYFRDHPSPNPLVSGYQPALHATLAGVRGFHTLMHDTPSLFSDYNVRTVAAKLRIAVSNRIVGYGLRSGGKTLVNSQYLRNACRHDFNIDAAIVRMAGLRPAPSAPQLRTVEGRLRMLSVCRIEASKRIDWMVRSLAELERDATPLSSRVDWQLDLAGKGAATAALTSMVNGLGIRDRVHFHGFVSDHALEDLFAHAHLFVMPAIQGYGIPAIESLQRGIPVLLHRESGVSDILLDTPWATVFTGGEDRMADAFRSAIDGLLQRKHHGVVQPRLPTEDEWAEQAATLCGWL